MIKFEQSYICHIVGLLGISSLWPVSVISVSARSDIGRSWLLQRPGAFVWSCQWKHAAGCCFDRRGVYLSGSSGHSRDKLHTSKACERASRCSAGATLYSCAGVLGKQKHFPTGFSSKPTKNVVGFFLIFFHFGGFPGDLNIVCHEITNCKHCYE